MNERYEEGVTRQGRVKEGREWEEGVKEWEEGVRNEERKRKRPYRCGVGVIGVLRVSEGRKRYWYRGLRVGK